MSVICLFYVFVFFYLFFYFCFFSDSPLYPGHKNIRNSITIVPALPNFNTVIMNDSGCDDVRFFYKKLGSKKVLF